MNTLLVITFIWQSQPHAAHFTTCHKQTRFRRLLETPCEITLQVPQHKRGYGQWNAGFNLAKYYFRLVGY